MDQPDFSLDGVNENECFLLQNGETVVETIRQATVSGNFKEFDLRASEGQDEYFFECLAYAVLDRYGKDRLYLAIKDLSEEENLWSPAYIAQRTDGEYLLVRETDEEMFNKFQAELNGMQSEEPAKKSRKGWKIAFAILLFPVWLIWQFIKALLSLFNIGFGDSSAVKSFKRGFNGDGDDMQEYTFTNDMGCEQTVYSSNGRDFYDANGSYVGSSNDGGKTIN